MYKVIICKENNKDGNAGASQEICQGEKVCAWPVLTKDAQMSTYLIWETLGKCLGSCCRAQ
jgi:hypothetical protein